MNKTTFCLLVATAAFAALRLLLPSHGLSPQDTFKDLAHVYVGGLFGAAIGTRRKSLWAMALGLTAVEVVAAIWQ